MRLSLLIFLFITVTSVTFGQKTAEVLANANGKSFTATDLSSETQKILASQSQIIAATRSQLVSKMVADFLIATEAKAKGVSPESLGAAEKAKATDPTEAQISAVLEANREALSDKTPAEARKQVVAFLRRDTEEAALNKYVETLTAKYKPSMGKDINAADLKPQDTIFSLITRSFTAKEFNDKYKLVLYDSQFDILDRLKLDLENTVYLSLVAAEAKSLGTDSGELIAKEITNRMKDFSDEERTGLEDGFRKKLFAKYNAKFLIKYPPPIVQSISIDGAPSRGAATAPVTVVMFSDFQCPACSATHPVLQKVLAEYGDKVRFVVRDFPLTSLHDHAFQAARAAYAANVQGKFFEYVDILYKSQSALDDASLSKYAASLGLNVKRFELDLSSENAASAVKKDMAEGASYGITGTPTIFVNGVATRHLSADGFREAIDTALSNK
jgi:protein-disulfide isomerase